jgi:hypothetical protein
VISAKKKKQNMEEGIPNIGGLKLWWVDQASLHWEKDLRKAEKRPGGSKGRCPSATRGKYAMPGGQPGDSVGRDLSRKIMWQMFVRVT